jgi:hypothetical protein
LIPDFSDAVAVGKFIKKLVDDFRDRKINFVEDSEILDKTKRLKKNREYEDFKRYVSDKNTRVLFQMGLMLRDLENNKPKWEGLRNRIFKTHNVRGLHIAQFVQNHLFSKYLSVVAERGLTQEQMSVEVQQFFDNIEVTNSFIQMDANVNAVALTIISRLRVNSPHVYVISGSYKDAIKKCTQVKDKVMKTVDDCSVSCYDTEITRVYFLVKKV